jgi:predicted nucleic acid-binding protein
VSRFVIDSSVLIKWFVPEIHSVDALRYLDPDLERDAPELLLAEVANVLWKRVGRGGLSPPEAAKIARDVE